VRECESLHRWSELVPEQFDGLLDGLVGQPDTQTVPVGGANAVPAAAILTTVISAAESFRQYPE
jgi:hypothetical protein